jgi:uncharacterized membrane protein
MPPLIRYHTRLWISLAFGAVVSLALPAGPAVLDRVLIGWDSGVTMFLVLLMVWMRGLSAVRIQSHYAEEDETAPVILAVVTVAALLSLVAIVELLATLKHVEGRERLGHFVLATVTLVDSWLLVPAMFTTHYADMFYSAAEDERPLHFPDTNMPAFWDFAYFSFTIAAACQTADVSTRGADVRKVLIGHQLISFVFNASILGFAINVTAGLIGG